MKNKVKYIFIMIIIASCIFLNRVFAYETIDNTENDGILVVSYNVTQNEENDFLNTIQTDYEENNVKYEFVNLNKVTEEISSKEIRKTVELKNLSTSDEENIRKMVKQNLQYEDREGYRGEMKISNVQVSTISNGVYDEIENLDIPVSGLSTNDLKDIDKEIESNGKRWYFINADWENDTSKDIDGYEIATTYKGILHYQTITQYNNPDTYNAVVYYSGTAKSSNPRYTYSVTYRIIEPEPEPEKEQVIEPVPEPVEEKKVNYVIPIIIVSGIGIVLITVLILMKKKKEK